MNLVKVSGNGQITLPIQVRRKLGIKEGDKILFLERENGEIVIHNASKSAIFEAQKAFRGIAKKMGVKNEDDVQAFVDEVRYGKDKQK